MRQVIDHQLQFGEQDIAAIALDPKSRDDIPQLLRGLQHIDTTASLHARVFAILAEVVPAGLHGKAATHTGRPGMEQWKILVLGVLRLGLNADYDRVHELANEHKTIRRPFVGCLGLPVGAMARRTATSCRPSRTTCACSPPRSWGGSIGKWSALGTNW